MTHFEFGSIINAIEPGGEAILGGDKACLASNLNTITIKRFKEDYAHPVIAMQISGNLMSSDDTLSAVFLLTIEDCGIIARMFRAHCKSLGKEYMREFITSFVEED